MRKGFKFVEKIAFELDEKDICLTLCPYDQESYISKGTYAKKRVGSKACFFCTYFSSMNNETVKCQYKWRSKFEKKGE